VKKKRRFGLAAGIAMVLIIAAVILAGCNIQEPTSATGVVSEVTMSKAVDSNGRPVDITNVFSEDDTGFHCSFLLSGFPVGAVLEVKWIYVGGDVSTENVTGENYVAETQTATITKEGKGYTYTVYSSQGVPDYKWPTGEYKVVISVDGLEKATTTFRVEQSPPGTVQ
jgi:hypothetical protein